MKNFFKTLSFVLIVGFLFNSCRNPAYNIDVLMDANIMNYKATFIVSDAVSGVPAGLTVSVNGQDAAKVYDFSATKAIYAPGGIATIGIPYMYTPTANAPLVFNMLFKAPGYMDKLIPVEIQLNQYQQQIPVTMVKLAQNNAADSYAYVASAPVTLAASGATTAPVTVTTPTTKVPEASSITIPTGTTFKSETGATLSGAPLTIQMVTYDATDAATIGMFPGGDFSAPAVTMPTLTGSAFFIPAALTTIRMFVGTTEVKSFSGPVSVTMYLDPTFVPDATGVPVAPGNVLPVYSYDVNTGVAVFESNQTVTLVGGKPALVFTTLHLCEKITGNIYNTTNCKDIKVTASASWLTEGSSRPVTVQVFNATGTRLLATMPLTLKDGLVSTLGKLPPIGVQYKVVDVTGEILANGTIADPCAGAPLNIVITKPAGVIENIRLVLNVTCPNKGRIIVPNFDLFFKAPGAADSDYKLLGTASKGILTTTTLKVGTTYQFKAIWGNQVKIVAPRTITSADMATTVGEGFYGDHAANENTALLIEACNNY